MQENSREKIIQLIRDKVVLKQEVYERANYFFQQTKQILQNILAEIQVKGKSFRSAVPFDYKAKGDFEVELTIGDDTLIFIIQSNVFTFPPVHDIWKSSYIKEDPTRAFCGKIYVYNFAADSFRYNRPRDLGHLIARIFINKEDHFFVEGERQMSFLFNDFSNDVMNDKRLEEVITSSILYALDFDPPVPPYESIADISVEEVLTSSLQSKFATASRLGFRLQSKRDGSAEF